MYLHLKVNLVSLVGMLFVLIANLVSKLPERRGWVAAVAEPLGSDGAAGAFASGADKCARTLACLA